MRKISRIKHVIWNGQGSAYLELLITLCILFAAVATLLFIPPAYSYKQDMDYMARKLVRAVEVTGTTDGIDGLYNQLSAQMGICPSVTWNVEYIAGTRNIQIRKTFTLTLLGSYKFIIFDPGFTPPLVVEMPVTTTLTGVSEVFFK